MGIWEAFWQNCGVPCTSDSPGCRTTASRTAPCRGRWPMCHELQREKIVHCVRQVNTEKWSTRIHVLVLYINHGDGNKDQTRNIDQLEHGAESGADPFLDRKSWNVIAIDSVWNVRITEAMSFSKSSVSHTMTCESAIRKNYLWDHNAKEKCVF